MTHPEDERTVNRIWQRVRGALGLGLLWAAGGAMIGGVIELVLNILPGPDLLLGVDMWPAELAVPGFLAGVVFAVVLSLTEGRRSFQDLTLWRLGGWGALGGLLLGAVVGLPVVVTAALSLTSGASAVATLALARKARPPVLVGDGRAPGDEQVPDDESA